HCLFVSAFMLASKVICDDTYSNKTWSIMVQGMFQLCKLTRTLPDLHSSLIFQDNPPPTTNFFPPPPAALNFIGQEPYPTYILPSSSK
ncbi:hypothetical protein DFJ58DRAFT_621328, partial [Suillus subalutaceus]|uniref:uncharacterized protein n=1 Tax=Suillus subalutaceus TaxID=48586 RepID=UPI001B85B911